MSTIYQVAKEAGVSAATVSRVLTRPTLVAASTRATVLAAIDTLGFIPNASAKSLRSLRTRKLLVTVPDIANPFFSQILQGLEERAQQAGYAVLLGDTQHDSLREERYAAMLRQKEADGLIFLGHRLPREAASVVRSFAPRCAPIVNGCEFSPTLGVPSVHIDNAKAAGEAMDHLFRLGHRRIGIITGPLESPLSRDRLRGALEFAKARRIASTCKVANGDFSLESGAAAGAKLLAMPRRPSAIFCFNDEMAMGLLQAAKTLGLHVPRDLSIVGFDDIRFARCVEPPLTTIAQPMRAIGAGTVDLLLAILDGGATPASVTLPHTFVVRASTAAPADG